MTLAQACDSKCVQTVEALSVHFAAASERMPLAFGSVGASGCDGASFWSKTCACFRTFLSCCKKLDMIEFNSSLSTFAVAEARSPLLVFAVFSASFTFFLLLLTAW